MSKQNYFSKNDPCKNHPELNIGGGIFTGGKNIEQIQKSDLYVCLDYQYLPSNYIFDSSQKTHLNGKLRIVFAPFQDMGIPKKENLKIVINKIIPVLKKGGRVHVQCIGGHGRTGTVLACLIHKINKETNPVNWVKHNYCEKAVESYAQVVFISEFTKTPLYTKNDIKENHISKKSSKSDIDYRAFPFKDELKSTSILHSASSLPKQYIAHNSEKTFKLRDDYFKCSVCHEIECDWSYITSTCTEACKTTN
jgi:hypothetical protein